MHAKDKDLVTALAEQAGEPLRAAVYARPRTALSPARWFGGYLAHYLVVLPAAAVAAHREAERTDTPVAAAMVLGLGASDLHIWSADPVRSQVYDHRGTIALDRIKRMHAEPGRSYWPLTITLAGGEELDLEARGDVGSLVGAFQQPAAG